jgi:hypothetical protein
MPNEVYDFGETVAKGRSLFGHKTPPGIHVQPDPGSLKDTGSRRPVHREGQ